LRYCKKCLMPDSRPNIYFNDRGICGACLYELEEKPKVDWDSRLRELQDIADWAKKSSTSVYDCVIGVSGGKDSTFQALTARDRLGLRPLLVNGEPEGITELGRRNIENLTNLGFDMVKLRPNPKVMRKLIKKDFYRCLNPIKVTEYSLWASAYIIASKFKIPLIIQGENPVMAVGSDREVGLDGNALNACKQQTIIEDWKVYIGDGVIEKDLYLFHYDKEQLDKENIRGVWLGWYVKEWSQPGNAEFSIAHGLTVRPEGFDPAEFGTYVSSNALDSDLQQVNQLLKFVKFGFGNCTEHACYDIREGRLSRKEAIELIRKYDGKCGAQYIDKFCDYIEISIEEFWRVVNSYRGPMWEKDAKGQWMLKDPIWEQEKVEV